MIIDKIPKKWYLLRFRATYFLEQTMTKNPFDANAWDYSRGVEEQILLVINLQPHLGDALVDRLDEQRRQHGGKAFGLVICQALAESFNQNGGEVSLSVPAWEAFDVTAQQKLLAHGTGKSGNLIIRSSALDEDWISAKSGEHRSLSVSSAKDFLQTLSFYAAQQLPVVVQEHVWGVGIVIDLVWSAVYGRVVARVAWGRGGNNGFRPTSATWDYQAHIGVFDPASGETLLGFETNAVKERGHLYAHSPFVAQLVRGLYQTLQSWKWQVGVQLELVVNYETPRQFHLVQIRPSPAALRGDIGTLPFPASKPLFTTAQVSRPFQARAPGYVVPEVFGRRPTAKEVAGKIVFWKREPAYYNQTSAIKELLSLGAVAQIGLSRVLNTVHNTPSDLSFSTERERLELQQQAYLIGCSCAENMDRRISYAIQQHKGDVLVVSDGVVGQVYLV